MSTQTITQTTLQDPQVTAMQLANLANIRAAVLGQQNYGAVYSDGQGGETTDPSAAAYVDSAGNPAQGPISYDAEGNITSFNFPQVLTPGGPSQFVPFQTAPVDQMTIFAEQAFMDPTTGVGSYEPFEQRAQDYFGAFDPAGSTALSATNQALSDIQTQATAGTGNISTGLGLLPTGQTYLKNQLGAAINPEGFFDTADTRFGEARDVVGTNLDPISNIYDTLRGTGASGIGGLTPRTTGITAFDDANVTAANRRPSDPFSDFQAQKQSIANPFAGVGIGTYDFGTSPFNNVGGQLGSMTSAFDSLGAGSQPTIANPFGNVTLADAQGIGTNPFAGFASNLTAPTVGNRFDFTPTQQSLDANPFASTGITQADIGATPFDYDVTTDAPTIGDYFSMQGELAPQLQSVSDPFANLGTGFTQGDITTSAFQTLNPQLQTVSDPFTTASPTLRTAADPFSSLQATVTAPGEDSLTDQAADLLRTGRGYLAGAAPAAENRFDPSTDVAAYMNPYNTAVRDVAIQQLQEAEQKQANQDAANAVAAGAFGGSRAAVMDAVRQSELVKNQAALTAQLEAQGYDKALANAMAAYEADKASDLAVGQAMTGTARELGQLGQTEAGISDIGFRQGLAAAQGTSQIGLANLQAAQAYDQQLLAQAQGELAAGRLSLDAYNALQNQLAQKAGGLQQTNIANQRNQQAFNNALLGQAQGELAAGRLSQDAYNNFRNQLLSQQQGNLQRDISGINAYNALVNAQRDMAQGNLSFAGMGADAQNAYNQALLAQARGALDAGQIDLAAYQNYERNILEQAAGTQRTNLANLDAGTAFNQALLNQARGTQQSGIANLDAYNNFFNQQLGLAQADLSRQQLNQAQQSDLNRALLQQAEGQLRAGEIDLNQYNQYINQLSTQGQGLLAQDAASIDAYRAQVDALNRRATGSLGFAGLQSEAAARQNQALLNQARGTLDQGRAGIDAYRAYMDAQLGIAGGADRASIAEMDAQAAYNNYLMNLAQGRAGYQGTQAQQQADYNRALLDQAGGSLRADIADAESYNRNLLTDLQGRSGRLDAARLGMGFDDMLFNQAMARASGLTQAEQGADRFAMDAVNARLQALRDQTALQNMRAGLMQDYGNVARQRGLDQITAGLGYYDALAGGAGQYLQAAGMQQGIGNLLGQYGLAGGEQLGNFGLAQSTLGGRQMAARAQDIDRALQFGNIHQTQAQTELDNIRRTNLLDFMQPLLGAETMARQQIGGNTYQVFGGMPSQTTNPVGQAIGAFSNIMGAGRALGTQATV